MQASEYFIIEDEKKSKTKKLSKNDSRKIPTINKNNKIKDSDDLKRKDSESLTTKKSSLKTLKKFRNLLNISLKIRKGTKVPKPMERLEESIVEDGELEKRPEKETTKLAMKSNNCAQKNILTTTGINQTNSILVLDRTQSDVTTRERQIMKQVPSPSQLSVPNKPSEALAEDYTQGSALPVLEVPVKYDPKMLEVKVKRRIRLYAKISFCMAYIILSITFLIFFIAMLGWWISFSAYTMLNFERLIRMTSDWKMKSVLNGPLTSQRCGMLKISTLPWNSWTECIRSRVQSAQWRWRNLSAGLYFVDQQLINIKWC